MEAEARRGSLKHASQDYFDVFGHQEFDRRRKSVLGQPLRRPTWRGVSLSKGSLTEGLNSARLPLLRGTLRLMSST